jgi:phosphopantetheinyl transferase (holo-ACP synthase)
MIGNDIVDLSDPEASPEACHERFDRRVFSPEEFDALPAECDDAQRRWILWAAKEAAYKAAKRTSPRVVFSPMRFAVDLDSSLRGIVQHEERTFSIRVQLDGDCVHAVVREGGSLSGVISGARKLSTRELCDASTSVRRVAIGSIARELGVDRASLQIESVDRIPHLVGHGAQSPQAISLAHHGSYAGFAISDPRVERASHSDPTRNDGADMPSRPQSDLLYDGADSFGAREGELF